MTRLTIATFALLTASLSAGCAGGGSAAAANPAATAETKSAAGGGALTFAAQVESGQALYGQHCAKCHGSGGEGASAPAVVGLKSGALPLEPRAGAMRKDKFVTVLDVGAFVMKNMPPSAPNSLTPDEYLAILAFDLKANEIDLPEALDLEKAKALTVPR